ncbi:uncharacterized protein LOC100893485 [Anopheles sinensis]|uniref:Uncharacterized protein LOC100893485 n=1 Tax=Anopheles sinensis TaxID=74873 RepID=A0A084WAZ3_ANOSI|nr:uncharacterized protein LOC100893485 [Anopheles sinensis]
MSPELAAFKVGNDVCCGGRNLHGTCCIFGVFARCRSGNGTKYLENSLQPIGNVRLWRVGPTVATRNAGKMPPKRDHRLPPKRGESNSCLAWSNDRSGTIPANLRSAYTRRVGHNCDL